MPVAQWPAFLTSHSNLPGPRSNLELLHAAAEEADFQTLQNLIASRDEYLVCCGVAGLGRFDAEPQLRAHAADDRWRVREGVAMALQRLGDDNLPAMVIICRTWADDPHPLVQRAAIAGICEPRLLRDGAARTALELCQRITDSLVARTDRKHPDVRTLRKALGYCWSVAVAADPQTGLPMFRVLESNPDPDVRWIVREDLKKKRLASLTTSA